MHCIIHTDNHATIRKNVSRLIWTLRKQDNFTPISGSSPMKLNNDTLDAIKNRRYQLRPVRRPSVQKKRRLSESAWDVRDVGMGDIAQILSRRISMGYSTIEEDTVSVKSFNSIRYFVTMYLLSLLQPPQLTGQVDLWKASTGK